MLTTPNYSFNMFKHLYSCLSSQVDPWKLPFKNVDCHLEPTTINILIINENSHECQPECTVSKDLPYWAPQVGDSGVLSACWSPSWSWSSSSSSLSDASDLWPPDYVHRLLPVRMNRWMDGWTDTGRGMCLSLPPPPVPPFLHTEEKLVTRREKLGYNPPPLCF